MKSLNVIPYDNGIPSFDASKDGVESVRKNYKINSLHYYFLTDTHEMPEKTFYVIIRHSMPLYDYVTLNNALPVHPDIIDYIRVYKNLKIIFLNDTEPDSEKVLTVLHEYMVHNKLSENQFVIINNNYKLSDLNIYDFQVYTSNRLDIWILEYMRHFEPKFLINKPSFFTCHNRVVKPHRYFLLANLKKMDILSDTDWSLLRAKSDIEIYKKIGGGNLPSSFYEDLYTENDLIELKEEMIYLDSLESKKSVYEDGFEFDQPCGDYMTTFEINAYKNAYVNLTTESRFEYYGIHISEKSLIPFYFYQIPLILASPGHISAMIKRYDLDFFTDLIDISYDSQRNHKMRFEMYLAEVKRLHEMKDEVIDFYAKNMNRLMKNRRKILAILEADSDYKYFNGVIAKEDGKII
jgi:hypothetical protein